MHFSASLISLFLATISLVDARMQRKRCEDGPSTPNVPGKSIDFSTYNSTRQTPEEFLNEMKFKISNNTVGSFDERTGIVPRIHQKRNVDIVDGALRLLVRGQSGQGAVPSTEIQSYDSFKFGTLETVARATPVAGVCQGIFFYDSDTAEIDIELLSSYYETGSGTLKPGVTFTNQALIEGQRSTSVSQDYGFDPTIDFHNYTIRWTERASEFYVDGQLRQALDVNVPSIASKIIFNNWSNGNINWSSGPPTEDAHFEIKSFKYTSL